MTYAGSEKALEQMLATYPNTDLFSVIDSPDNQGRWFLNNLIYLIIICLSLAFIHRLAFQVNYPIRSQRLRISGLLMKQKAMSKTLEVRPCLSV